MSPFRVAGLLAICGIVFCVVGESASAQNSAAKQATQPDDIAKSIAESVSGTLQFAEGNFLGVAEAMPEDKYSYIPTGGNFDGVRSFGEQVKHVACAQFAFFNEFEGKKPPDDCEKGGHDPAKTKAELIKYLKDSFDYSNRVLTTLTANNALDRVEGRYAGPNTESVTRTTPGKRNVVESDSFCGFSCYSAPLSESRGCSLEPIQSSYQFSCLSHSG